MLALWAKTHPDGDYLQVDRHLDDAGAVAVRLFDLALTDRQREWIAATLGVNARAARQLLGFMAAAHDVGKISPWFQNLAPDLARRLGSATLGTASDGLRHDAVSGVVVERFVERHGGSAEVAERLAATVSGHHGIPRCLTRRHRQAVRSAPDWHPHQDAALDRLKAGFGVDFACLEEPSDAVILALAGLISSADWIASDVRHFPVTSGARQSSARLAERAVRATVWAPHRAPETTTFEELFGFAPRAAQQAMIDTLAETTLPALLILEDRTGAGKTEAALWASLRALQDGARGIYVGLPTRATAGQFHGRARGFLQRLWPQLDSDELRLLHGGVHGTDADPGPTQVDANEQDAAAREWFAAARRGLLSPYAVGTIDQALLGVLLARHYPVRLWGLAGKVVVLDEVHAYDSYTGLLLEELVKWLGALGCSVVLLSATLPVARRQDLTCAFRAGAGHVESDTEDHVASYPRLTVASARGTHVVEITDDRPPRCIRLEHEAVADDADAVAALVTDEVRDGGCLAVVCSTVAAAQERYHAIRGHLPDVEVVLLHARLRPLERLPVEQKLFARLGPASTGDQRPRQLVVVATQVIEQSLDLDFDVMLSDVAPIDLLVQRAGRVHRHAGRQRTERHRAPRLVVLDTPGNDVARPRPHRTEAVYVPAIVARTRAALRDRPVLVEPDDLDGLIATVYGGAPPDGLTADEHAALRGLDGEADEMRRHRESGARQWLIASPGAEEPQWTVQRPPGADADDPQATSRNAASTRWTDRPSLDVIVLAAHEDHLVDAPLSSSITRELLQRAVGVSAPRLVNALLGDQESHRPKAWRKHGALRHHFLIVLDDANSLPIDWDPVLGVQT